MTTAYHFFREEDFKRPSMDVVYVPEEFFAIRARDEKFNVITRQKSLEKVREKLLDKLTDLEWESEEIDIDRRYLLTIKKLSEKGYKETMDLYFTNRLYPKIICQEVFQDYLEVLNSKGDTSYNPPKDWGPADDEDYLGQWTPDSDPDFNPPGSIND